MNIEEWITIGIIKGVKGLKGELRIKSQSDFPERFTKKGIRWLQKSNEEPVPVNLLRGSQHPGKDIFNVIFEGINSRDKSEKLIGHKLLVKSNDLPELKDGEYHLMSLLNLNVKLKINNEIIGKVIGLEKAGNDLLLVKMNDGKNIYIPFVDEIVPSINLKEKWIIITPPEGLLNL